MVLSLPNRETGRKGAARKGRRDHKVNYYQISINFYYPFNFFTHDDEFGLEMGGLDAVLYEMTLLI